MGGTFARRSRFFASASVASASVRYASSSRRRSSRVDDEPSALGERTDTSRVVARRYSDGTVEMFTEPSGRTERTLQSELLVPKRENSQPGNSTEKTIARQTIPLETETTYDGHGNERVVTRRARKPI